MPASNSQLRIREFLGRYLREYDFYQEVSRRVATICESALQAGGIRAIVSYRAKRVESLARKVIQRATDKEYEHIEDIYEDIKDLSGVRVALYFPSDDIRVDTIIKDLFNLSETEKTFPDQAEKRNNDIYTKRFSGYRAKHYRVLLKPDGLEEAQRRYASVVTEIQVASVLMHAWSEVEHDLVYKPVQGLLSEEEYAILDEINGLVLAGEIALERLQKAGERRTTATHEFSNHYELASFLYEELKGIIGEVSDIATGRVDLLFSLLERANLNQPDKVKAYLQRLTHVQRGIPLAEQVIKLILNDKQELTLYYLHLKSERAGWSGSVLSYALRQFVSYWYVFTDLISNLIDSRFPSLKSYPQDDSSITSANLLEQLGIFSPEEIQWLSTIKFVGGELINEGDPKDQTSEEIELEKGRQKLEEILLRLSQSNDSEVRYLVNSLLGYHTDHNFTQST